MRFSKLLCTDATTSASILLSLATLLHTFSTVAATTTWSLFTHGFSNSQVGKSTGGGSTCVTGQVKMSINATGTKINYKPPQDEMGVAETFVEMFQAGSSFAAKVMTGGPSVIQGDYNIFTKLCVPSSLEQASKIKTVQLLSHGATLDHTYWDIAPGYSYVDVAAQAGYATVSFDQLGVGESDHPDPINVVQANAQVAVLHQLVQLLRSAKIGRFQFEHVVGVAHSAGSAITQGITTQYPKDFDAVILSGTSTVATSVPLTIAALNLINANTDPSPKLRNLPVGFLTPRSSIGIQTAYYRYPNFDLNAFQQQVKNKATNNVGLLLTLAGILAPSTEFTGPVDIVNGQNDLVFCGGDCLYPTDQNLPVLAVFYPAASKTGSQTYIAPGSGHCIAAHKSGPDSFKQMIQFLKANKL